MKHIELRTELRALGFVPNCLRKVECVGALQFISELCAEFVNQRIENQGDYYDRARGVYVARGVYDVACEREALSLRDVD